MNSLSERWRVFEERKPKITGMVDGPMDQDRETMMSEAEKH
jgi:hypothetical protein